MMSVGGEIAPEDVAETALELIAGILGHRPHLRCSDLYEGGSDLYGRVAVICMGGWQ